jgi:hypothetical protein
MSTINNILHRTYWRYWMRKFFPKYMKEQDALREAQNPWKKNEVRS